MIREVTLLVTGEASLVTPTGGASRDPSSSPYATGTPLVTLAECWNDNEDGTYFYFAPMINFGGLTTCLASWDPPPTLVLIRKVTLRAWWSFSQARSNNWFGPPTNAYNPRARLAVRNRAGSGNLFSAYRTITYPADADHNENINNPGSYTGPLLQEWETTAHPEGGPWTVNDLSPASFAAGIEFDVAAPAFDNNEQYHSKVRAHKVSVVLEVEDLGGFVQNIRHSGSTSERMLRRARNAVPLRYMAEHAVAEQGGLVYLSHPRGAAVGSSGWGKRRLERRPGQVTRRVILPEQVQYQDEVFDREAYRCLFWAAYRIDAPWSPELQGLSLLDKGGSFTHDRGQDGWSPRPGDGVLMRVLEDYPNLSFHGLACQGGGDIAIALQNFDLMQAGWSTVGSAGDFTVTASTTVTMVEELGYLSSAQLAYGGGGGTGGRERSLGTLPFASGDFMHVRVVLKNTSVPVPATDFGEWYLRRTGGGLGADEFWDEAGRVWTVVATYNPVPSDDAVGESIADAIPCDAPGAVSDPTYLIGVGRFSSAMSSVTLHGAIVDVQHGGPGAGDSYGTRTPLVTLAVPITREPDIHRLTNSLAAELWSYVRGAAAVEVQPYWRAEVLPDAEVKPLLHAFHAANTWDALQFVADSSEDDLIRFERAVNGQATFQLDCPIPGLDLNRSHILRAWVRYLGADGWMEYGPYSVEVGYAVFLAADGSLVSSGSVLGRLAYEGAMTSRDYLAIGNDHLGRYADADVRMVEVRRNPVSGLVATWRM